MRDYEIEAMQEILAEYDIEVSFENADGIASDFIERITQIECEIPVPCPNKESDFERTERLQKDFISRLKTIKNKACDERVTVKTIYDRASKGIYEMVEIDGVKFIVE